MRHRWPIITMALMTILYAAFFSWFSVGRHWKTNSGRFDLGNMEQVAWNLSHGHGFTMTDPYGTTQVSRLAFHADFLLMPMAGIYAVFPWTETLLLLQVFAIASGVIASYVIGRKILGSPWWGVVAATVYMMMPGIHWSLIFDVHAVTFVTPLVLWAVVALLSRRMWLTLSLIILAMVAKEEIGLMLPAVGIYTYTMQHQRRWGLTFIVVPLVWSLIMMLLVLPYFHGTSATSGEVYQSVFGVNAASMIFGSLQHPLQFAHVLLAKQNLLYAWQLLVSGGLVSVFSGWWLAAIPEFVINAMSLKPAQHLIISHYTSGITPWLLLSTIFGLAWLKRHIPSRMHISGSLLNTALAGVVLVSSVVGAWWLSPLPFTPHDQTKFVTWSNPYASVVRDWAKRIPTTAAVSVTNDVGSQFARRQFLYSFPFGIEKSEYIVVLENHATPVVATDADVSALVSELRTNADWTVLEQQGDLTVLRRR